MGPAGVLAEGRQLAVQAPPVDTVVRDVGEVQVPFGVRRGTLGEREARGDLNRVGPFGDAVDDGGCLVDSAGGPARLPLARNTTPTTIPKITRMITIFFMRRSTLLYVPRNRPVTQPAAPQT